MASPTFSTRLNATTRKAPFTLDGEVLDDDGEPTYHEDGEPVIWTETFKVLPQIPGAVLDRLMASVSNVDGEVRYHRLSIIQFLRDVIVPNQVARFEALISDKHRVVDVMALGAAVDYLTEEDTGRPTVR